MHSTLRFARPSVGLVAGLLLLLGSAACTQPGPGATGQDQGAYGSPNGDLGGFHDQVWHNSCYGPLVEYQSAQVFTAGRSGTLDKVSLMVDRATNNNTSAGDLVVNIHSVDVDGKPLDDVLGGGTYSGAGSPSTWTQISLPNTVPVTTGEEYAIVLSTDATANCAWWDVYGNLYTGYLGGDHWNRTFANWSWTECCLGDEDDLDFITWVH